MSIEIARANMISGLQRLAEEFKSSAAGLAALRSAEGLMDAETRAFIEQLNRAASQLTLMSERAENSFLAQNRHELKEPD
jgi:signal transduction histidine kinase